MAVDHKNRIAKTRRREEKNFFIRAFAPSRFPSGLMFIFLIALAGTVALAAPKRAKGPDWAAARTAFASAPALELDESVFFACSATWGLWGEALDSGRVKVPAGALPPQLVDPKAGETAARARNSP